MILSQPSSGLLSDGKVEILGGNGAHYRASVVDVIDPSDPCCADPSAPKTDRPLITLRFENNWKRVENVPMSAIRLPPLTIDTTSAQSGADQQKKADFKEGTEVEALVPGVDGEGIWKCVIKMIKGDFYLVSYLLDKKYDKSVVQKHDLSEVVPKDKIRAINTNPYLTSNPFFKLVIEVPKELVSFNRSVITRSETHKHFKRVLSLIAINYNISKNCLVGIGFADTLKSFRYEMTRKSAMILSEMHFRSLKQEMEILAEKEGLVKRLKSCDEVIKHNDNGFELFVEVDHHLIGLAIGSNGSNLKRALSLNGVVSVDQSDGIFRIIATSRESCLAAKQVIQVMERVVNISTDIVSHVIGRRGQYVQELVTKSGLINVLIKDMVKKGPNEAYVPFHMIGTKQAIEDASLILDFQKTCLKENIEIDKKIGPKKVNKKY